MIKLFNVETQSNHFSPSGVYIMNDMSDASGVEIKLLNHALSRHIPINAGFELTPLCNLNCEMCYVRLDRARLDTIGKLLTPSQWLDIAKEMRSAGTLFILLTGGEPLLYPDFKELYESLQKLGFILTVNTNGTLIDEDWVLFFSKHKPRRINLSVYGSSESAYDRMCHYAKGFKAATSAIRLLKENNVDVRVSSSATKYNSDDQIGIQELCRSLNVPLHTDSYMYPAKRERDTTNVRSSRLDPEDAAKIYISDLKNALTPEDFLRTLKNLAESVEDRMSSPPPPTRICGTQCLAGNCSVTVSYNGLLRPCVMLDNPSFPVLQTGFERAWSEMCDALYAISLDPGCNSCAYRPLCHICAASAIHEDGRYDSVPAYLCETAEKTYDLLREELRNAGEYPITYF